MWWAAREEGWKVARRTGTAGLAAKGCDLKASALAHGGGHDVGDHVSGRGPRGGIGTRAEGAMAIKGPEACPALQAEFGFGLGCFER